MLNYWLWVTYIHFFPPNSVSSVVSAVDYIKFRVSHLHILKNSSKDSVIQNEVKGMWVPGKDGFLEEKYCLSCKLRPLLFPWNNIFNLEE